MAKPKLLLIDHYAQLGGGQTVFIMLAQALQARYDVLLAYPQYGDVHQRVQSYIGHMASVDMPDMQGGGWFGKLTLSLKNLVAIPTLMRSAKSTTQLYLNGMRLLPAALITALLRRKPLIVHVHLVYGNRSLRILAQLVRIGLIKRLVFCSEYCFQAFCQLGSSAHALLLTNALPITTQQAKPSFASTRFQTLRCGFFGRPTVAKGINTIVQMAMEFDSLAFDCYGATDCPSKQQIDYPQNCYEHNKVISVAQIVVEQRINIVLVPSIRPESFGLVAIEAMAAGAIVIVRNIGGLMEIAHYTGALNFIKDSELAALLHSVIKMTPTERAKLAKQQYQKTLTYYDVMQFRKTLLSDIVLLN